MSRPKLRGFSEACFNMNTDEELIDALVGRKADTGDCKEWNLTPTQWREAIADALRARIFYLREECGQIPERIRA
jgi:hypothetical protein